MSDLPISSYIKSLRIPTMDRSSSSADRVPVPAGKTAKSDQREKRGERDFNENVTESRPAEQGDHEDNFLLPSGEPYFQNGRLYNAFGKPAVLSSKEKTLWLQVPKRIVFTREVKKQDNNLVYYAARFYLTNPSKNRITFKIVSTEPRIWAKIHNSCGLLLPNGSAEILVVTRPLKVKSEWTLIHHLTASYFVVLSVPLIFSVMADTRKLEEMWSFVGTYLFPLDACEKQPIPAFEFKGQEEDVFDHSSQLQVTEFLVRNWSPWLLRWKVRNMKTDLASLLENGPGECEEFEGILASLDLDDSVIGQSFAMLKEHLAVISERTLTTCRESWRHLLTAFVIFVILFCFQDRFLPSSETPLLRKETVAPPRARAAEAAVDGCWYKPWTWTWSFWN